MKLTRKKAIELHRELWDWLYHHLSKEKVDWPRWEENGGDIPEMSCSCFACEYRNNGLHRSCCILVWNTEKCYADSSYYDLFEEAKSPKTRKKYAKLIRDLKERK